MGKDLKLADNLGLKLLSVALAFAIWLYVNSQGLVSINFAVPIEPRGLADGLILADISETTADVRLKGRENTLDRVSSRRVQVYIDLSGTGAGEHWVGMDHAHVEVSPPVEVSSVMPRQVRVKIERRATRKMALTADVEGEPVAGYKITGIRVKPEQVTVTGPESAFDGLARLRTQPVDISGLTASLTREVRLDFGGRDLKVTEGAPVYVTIDVEAVSAKPPTAKQ